MNFRGQEFHSIIANIFDDVKGLNENPQIQVCCPRCEEAEGLLFPDGKFNLEINTEKRVFRCWKCEDPKFSGSLGKLIKLYGSNMDLELYKSYASIYSDFEFDEDYEYDEVLVNVELPSEMILFTDMDVTKSEHFAAYNYLVNERKINRDVILKYRLGFCVSGKYVNRIIIPSYDINNELNYFVSRTYDSNEKRKYKNPKIDKDNIIFNEWMVNWDSTVYIVEGVTDMFSVPNAIPLLGKTISTALYYKLKQYQPNVIILLDPDAYKNAIDLYYTIEKIYVGCTDKIRLIKLPTDDDIDELRKFKGEDFVIECIYNAKSLDTEDYFMINLKNDTKRRGGYDSNSKYFEWKSGSTRNHI